MIANKELYSKNLTRIIENAIEEDCVFNDVTSDLIILENKIINFEIKARQSLVLCGVDAISEIFKILCKNEKFRNSEISFRINFEDGNLLEKCAIIASGKGNAKLIFACERIILNILQMLSSVSTKTRNIINLLNNPEIKITDTRKTLPSMRYLQKYATFIGGAKNHRMNLSDMILIKDNHIAASDFFCTKNLFAMTALPTEIECDNLEQVKKALLAKPGIIMLDNMTIPQIEEAIILIDKKCKIEISGNINEKNIENYSHLKIDYIAIGGLTHSIEAVDIGLDIL